MSGGRDLEQQARKFLNLPELRAAWTSTQTTMFNILVEFGAALRAETPAPRERPNELYHLICDTMEAEAVRLNEDTWSVSLAGAIHDAVQSLAAAQPPQELVSPKVTAEMCRKAYVERARGGWGAIAEIINREVEAALTRGGGGRA